MDKLAKLSKQHNSFWKAMAKTCGLYLMAGSIIGGDTNDRQRYQLLHLHDKWGKQVHRAEFSLKSNEVNLSIRAFKSIDKHTLLGMSWLSRIHIVTVRNRRIILQCPYLKVFDASLSEYEKLIHQAVVKGSLLFVGGIGKLVVARLKTN